MAETLVGYARCCTTSQDVRAQLSALKQLGVTDEHLHPDRGRTGRNRERPGLTAALGAVRDGGCPGGDQVGPARSLGPGPARHRRRARRAEGAGPRALPGTGRRVGSVMAPSLVPPTAHPQAPCPVSPSAPRGGVLPRTGSCPRGTPHRRRTGANTPGRRRTRPKHAPGPAPPSCGPCNPTGGADARGRRHGVGPREGSFRGSTREGAPGVRGRRWVVQGVTAVLRLGWW